MHAVGGQGGDRSVGQLGSTDEQRARPVEADEQVGEKDRIALDVAAAQVRDPRDVVEA